MASAFARNHLDLHAHFASGRDGSFGIVAGWIEQGEHAEELPAAVAIVSCHAQCAKTACGEFVDCFVDSGFDLNGIGRQRQNHLRRALGHFELPSVRALDGGFGAFMHRVERDKVKFLIALQGFAVLHAAEHGQVNGVVVFRAKPTRPRE